MDEPRGEHMEQKPPDKLVRGSRHDLGAVALPRIPPLQEDLIVLEGH